MPHMALAAPALSLHDLHGLRPLQDSDVTSPGTGTWNSALPGQAQPSSEPAPAGLTAGSKGSAASTGLPAQPGRGGNEFPAHVLQLWISTLNMITGSQNP